MAHSAVDVGASLASPFFERSFIGLPIVGDEERATETLQELEKRYQEHADKSLIEAFENLLNEKSISQLLRGIFSNSPFLTQCALSDPPFLRRLLETGPDTVFGSVIDHVKDNVAHELELDELKRELRIARKRVALLVAISDITGTWSLDRVTQALSDFADVAISASVSHLLRAAANKGELVLRDDYFPEYESGYFALAMGKYGARELNYSSDIDLIVIYDPVKIDYRGNRSAQQLLVRLTRELVSVLQDLTGDGFVFRVDLRLRPDPSSTPVAIPYANAVGYYETRGAGWERAAMIKARPAVGDLVLGRQFMSELVPFVWRPAVDFWAQREMSKIKRQINEQRGSSEIGVLGHNIKLGRGGIREIEFFAQSLQLVHGGRDPYLRSTRTLDALSTLAESRHISERTADEMTEAYEFLRQLEHRLQMVNDQQTQTLPSDEDGLRKIAAFMGYGDLDDFQETLLGYLRIVEAHYSSMFEDGSASEYETELDLSAGSEADGKLSEVGFRELNEAFARIQKWQAGAYSAVRDERSQELIRALTPRIIEAAAKSSDPDFLIEQFDYFLKNLKAGVRCLSTLSANPELLDILLDWLGVSPALIEELCQWPERLQGLVSRTGFEGAPDARVLAADCAQLVKTAADPEDAHHSVAAWANESRFIIATQVANNTIDCLESGRAFTNVADAAVTAVYRGGIAERNDNEGEALPPFAVLGIGQYGTQELTHGGPIDLLFVCGEDSDLAKASVPAIRRFLYALGAPTRSGKIAGVNFGRTPYGTEAPIVTDFASLLAHCETRDGLATMLALPKARLVFTPNGMGQDVEMAIRNYLTNGDAGRVLSARRQEILKSIHASRNGHSWDVRYCQGGINELETLVTVLQIEAAPDHPDVLTPHCSAAIDLLLSAGRLDAVHGKQLIEAHHLMRQIESFLAVTTVGRFEPESVMSRTESGLARTCGAEDIEDIEVMLRGATTSVRAAVEATLNDTY